MIQTRIANPIIRTRPGVYQAIRSCKEGIGVIVGVGVTVDVGNTNVKAGIGISVAVAVIGNMSVSVIAVIVTSRGVAEGVMVWLVWVKVNGRI
jgi:hypothetical protein